MSTFQLPANGWTPRREQLKAWNAMTAPGVKQVSLAAHRRFGKDALCLHATAVHGMSRIGSYAYCLPEYSQARKAIWEGLDAKTGRTRIADAFPNEIVAKRDNEAMMLWLESGSTIQLIGSDRPDSLVGSGYAGIVLSEAALSNPEAKIFLMPMLEESGGWLFEISTPRGKNAFHKSHIGATADMMLGVPGVYAERIDAEHSSVFSPAQLLRIRMNLIRDHGHTIGTAMYEQEYMVSFEAAVMGAVWGSELTDLQLSGRERLCAHDRRFPVFTSWDIGVRDATVILFWQDIGGQYRLIDGYESTDSDDELFVDAAKSGTKITAGIGLQTAVEALHHRRNKYGYRYAKHHAPHDVSVREWVRGVSRKDEAKRTGLELDYTPNTRLKTQISVGAQLINAMVVNTDSHGAMRAYEHFKGYHYPKMGKDGVQQETPVHDGDSHASSALMTYAIKKASELGMAGAVLDDELRSGQDLQNGEKFDPRRYGNAPYGTRDQRMPQQGTPRRGAFG